MVDNLMNHRDIMTGVKLDMQAFKDFLSTGVISAVVYAVLVKAFGSRIERQMMYRYAIVVASIIGAVMVQPKVHSMLGF
jgi:uncharacterized membrane protein YeaQ/YmgE (transglycosylase-associated protein family)